MTTNPVSEAARELVERLRIQARKSSAIQQEMAEAKSLRQEGNRAGRKDLYMWPKPEETIEGRAADFIEREILTRSAPEAEALARALEKARGQFAHYADLHACKNTPDGDAKAAVNLALANEMQAALTAYRTTKD